MNSVIGQYVDLDTFVHRLHPMTKLLSLICLIAVTLMFSDFYIYLVQFILLLGFLKLAKLPLRIIARSLWGVRFLFLFIFIFNVIFIQEGALLWQWSFIKVYSQTLTLSVNLVSRLLLLTSYAMILTLSTKPLDLTYALEQKLQRFGSIAHILAMILAIALRFIPTLQEEAHKIIKAQKARGASFEEGSIIQRAKHLVSLLIPLFIISFNRAEVLAVAMELRGYDPNEKRTQYHVLLWQQRDRIVSLCIVTYALLVISIGIFWKI